MYKWEGDIHALRKTSDKYHQESYPVVAFAFQLDWIFLQHVMKDTGQAFTGMEKVLQGEQFPRLFFVTHIPSLHRRSSKYVVGKESWTGPT